MSSSSSATASVIFMTVVSALAVYRQRNDLHAISFVVSAYLLLMLFFLSLRWFEALPPDDISRKREARVVVCLLATSLNMLFSWKVSSMLPPSLAAVVWAVSLTTAGAGFYLLICLKEA